MTNQTVERERKVALVTGASRGIGRAIAVELAGLGYDIVINYLRNSEAAEETLRLVEAQGGRGWLAPANIGEPAEIKELFEEVRQHQPLEVVIHNAALGTFKPLLEIRPNQLELAFQVNVFALLWLAKEAFPLMAGRGGKLITLTSTGSDHVIPNYGIVGPSKAALEAMMRYLAVELKPHGINVNAVSGGFIDTDALKAFPDWEQMAAAAIARTPAGRLGQPADLARVVGMLANDKAGWICGQVILADGGCSLT